MKKVLSISLIVVFTFTALAFATPKSTDVVESSKSEETVLTPEEEALYCKIELPGGGSVTCWFCDCGELAQQVL